MIATFDKVAKWYGQVIGLVDVTSELSPGVIGLLGPNGAGKSTFLKLLTGQLRPSQGTVRLLGRDPFLDSSVHEHVGFCPEPDAFYEDMTGREFVTYLTRLHGFGRAETKRRTDQALERVDMTEAQGRRIRTYSKGMRQRIKLAQAIAHEPQVLVLDEPLTGMDPVARRRTQELVREMGAAGTTVLVSSHVLHEVETMTHNVVLLYQGRVRAYGSLDDIRGFLSQYPHKILVRSERARDLARALLEVESVAGVRLDGTAVHVETYNPEEFYDKLPGFVLDAGLPVDEIEAQDASLDAIFAYLVS
ncbi:MAG: ABC transporter ATP-binding protein [Planctomycetota bacterium]